MKHASLRCSLALALVLLSTSLAAAQAWVAPKGELSLALRSDFQESQGVWHGSVLVTGLPVYAFNDSLSAEYVPIKHLAFAASLDGNDIAYKGPQSIPGSNLILAHGSQDDGNFHANITDLELEGRYQLYDGWFTFTPVIRGKIPVTDYEQKGYAAAGSHLREISFGAYIGKYGLGLDNLVLQASYTYTYVQKEDGGGAATEQYRVNRSDADLVLAYFVVPKLGVGIGGAFRWTANGFDLSEYPNLAPGSTLVEWHDPVLRARYFAPVALASYQFTRAWSLMLRVADIVWGQNVSNALSVGLTVGYAHNFLGN